MENVSQFVAQDNALTLSRHNFKVIEKRCLYFIIKEVRHLYVENDKGNKDLFDNMNLVLKASQLQKLGDEPKDVYIALKSLSNRTIEIENEDMWLYTRFILQAKHDKKADVYRVDVSRDILPYLVELAQNFTSYDLTVAITLKSTYSQRFYEFCCMYKARNSFFLTVEQLRTMLKVEDKYKNIAHLKQYVLDVAQRELKALYDKGECDLYFTYAVKDTEGRKILSYYFFVHTKETEQKEMSYGEIDQAINRMRELLDRFIKKDAKYKKKVINELLLRPDIACEVAEKLDKRLSKYGEKDMPKLIRYVLDEDYNIRK